MMLSNRSRAAVVVAEAEDEGSESDVEGEGDVRGGEKCVLRNWWYVCSEERMKRQDSGMMGRPRRLIRSWVVKAYILCQ